MPPRKRKAVKTIHKTKSSTPSTPSPVTTATNPTHTPQEPSLAADFAVSNDPTTENDRCPDPEPEIEPEPEPEPEAKPLPEVEITIAAPEVSNPASEEAPEDPGVKSAETTSAEPVLKPGTKTVIRVRKVLRKKIVKKLVPKGSVAAKKVDAEHPQDGEKDLNPNYVLDSSIQPDAAEKTFNPNSAPDETDKLVSGKSEEGVEIKEDCRQMEAEDGILESRKEGNRLEAAEAKKVDPKGSVEAKKVDIVPQIEGIISLRECIGKDLNRNSILDSSIQRDATEKTSNPNAELQPEPENTVPETEDNVEMKEERGQMEAKGDLSESRKVVRKKIVKKLVRKGSVAAKKENTEPLQDGSVSLRKSIVKDLNPNSILDDSIQKDATEKIFNPNANQQPPEVEMEEAEKIEAGKSEDNVEIKEKCGQMEAKDDILESGKERDGLEAAEVKEQEVAGLSERMKRRKTEIFIGGLDRDANEEDLRSVFGKVGEVLEVRMMMDGQTGKNKGYAFLRYVEPSQAKRAVTEFTKVEIRGKMCGAAAVQGNDTIFLGNIEKKWKKEDVMKLLKEAGIENIDTVTVVMDPNNTDCNRGFAFLELETNRDAQRAYKKLQKNDVLGKGRNIKVAWADSFNIPDEEDMQKVKSVYAEGVPDSWDEDRLKESFRKFGEIERVVLGRNIKSAKRRDIAFINYKTREAALSCIESFSSDELTDNGSKINLKVALAKRVQKVNQSNIRKFANTNSLKVIYKPVQGLPSQDYSPAVPGAKRTFSALGDGMYSDLRGYPRTRLDSSSGIPGSSYAMMPHGVVGSSLPNYQHQPLHPGYSTTGTGTIYRSGSHTDTYQMNNQGVPSYTSSLYHRYQM